MKCPYCHEEIQDDALVCRACGRVLVAPSPLGKAANGMSRPKAEEPSRGVSFFYTVLLFIVIIGVGVFIQGIWFGSLSTLQRILEAYVLGAAVVVTILAVPGCDPARRGFWRYAGVFLLSLVPIAGFIPLYWAGRCLARKLALR